jgi:hypothetical protein
VPKRIPISRLLSTGRGPSGGPVTTQVMFECRCGAVHEGAPDGESGCGWYGALRLPL